jgi:3-keto-5-aminohexanoate cleavage enzyme
MGVKNAMPVDKNVFDYYVETVNRLAPNTEWCGAGIGSGQILVNEWSIAAGGHTRTGLEDNIRLDKNELAKSNAQLVELASSLCEKYSRPVATHTQARQILGL